MNKDEKKVTIHRDLNARGTVKGVGPIPNTFDLFEFMNSRDEQEKIEADRLLHDSLVVARGEVEHRVIEEPAGFATEEEKIEHDTLVTELEKAKGEKAV